MDRRQFMAAVSGFAIVASLPAVVLAEDTQPVTGGTLNVGFISDVRTLDPLQSSQWTERQILFLIFDTLLETEADFSLKPALAKSWEFSDDGKRVVLKLQEGVKFHDGTPFNAQAVAWNFARQKDPKNNCRCAFYIANILSVEAKDDLTVVYTLKDPAVAFPLLLTRPDQNSTIHSPAAIQAKGDDYNRNPVGTGPFAVKSWTAGDRMVVERNPNYWDKGKPHLDRVVLRPLPDSQSRFASLKSGESDVVWVDEFEADNIVRAKKDPTLQVLSYSGSGAAVNAIHALARGLTERAASLGPGAYAATLDSAKGLLRGTLFTDSHQ